jgi:hypothetical protein
MANFLNGCIAPVQHILIGFSTCLQFDVHVSAHCVKFLIIIPTRCTNLSNLFLEWKSTCFTQFPLSIIRSSSLYTRQWYTSYRFAEGIGSGAGSGFHPDPARKWRTPDGEQRNCLKHVEFHSKIKFEKLVHLVGFIIRKVYVYNNYHFVLCKSDKKRGLAETTKPQGGP